MALSYRDYSGAERAFARAAELDPTAYEHHLYLAYALDGQKGRDPKKGLAAGEAFEKVLSLRSDYGEAVCGAGWAYTADRTGWDKAIAFLERCKGLDATAADQKQIIDTKVQGLQAMLKAGEPQPAAEPEKKEAPQAVGGGGEGSMLDKVSDQAAQQEGVPAEEAAPAPVNDAEPAPAQ
jgi:cytochrome c-type biogenesis protein CcmH/NrfG